MSRKPASTNPLYRLVALEQVEQGAPRLPARRFERGIARKDQRRVVARRLAGEVRRLPTGHLAVRFC